MFSSNAFTTILSNLDAAIGWLESMGIRYSGTRIDYYRNILQNLITAQQLENWVEEDGGFAKVRYAAFEVDDIVEIYLSLAGKYDDYLKDRYTKFVTGPVTLQDEGVDGGSVLARNIGFELLIAAKIVRANLPLLQRGRTDVTTGFSGKELLIECKRLQSLEKVEKRFRDASRQLIRKIDGPLSSHRRGMVAIDITKALKDDLLVIDAKDEEDLFRRSSIVAENFNTEHIKVWQCKARKRKIALLIRFAFLAVIEEKGNMLTCCQDVVVTNLPKASDSDFALLKAFVERIRMG